MSENRVDLGNVKGDKGNTGVGIVRVVETGFDETNLKRQYRMYFSDSTDANPHFFEYELTDNEFIKRLNELSVGNPSSDKKNVPTIYLLKNELLKRPLNTEVYHKSLLYTKDETSSLIADMISNLDLVEVVTKLPTTNIKDNRIYLVTKNADSTDDLNTTFDLYLYVNNNWKKIDDLKFSISNFYNKSQTDALIDDLDETKLNTSDLTLLNIPVSSVDSNVIGIQAQNLRELITNLNSRKQDSNLVTSFSSNLSDSKYPSEKLVKNYVDNLVGNIESDMLL